MDSVRLDTMFEIFSAHDPVALFIPTTTAGTIEAPDMATHWTGTAKALNQRLGTLLFWPEISDAPHTAVVTIGIAAAGQEMTAVLDVAVAAPEATASSPPYVALVEGMVAMFDAEAFKAAVKAVMEARRPGRAMAGVVVDILSLAQKEVPANVKFQTLVAVVEVTFQVIVTPDALESPGSEGFGAALKPRCSSPLLHPFSQDYCGDICCGDNRCGHNCCGDKY